MMRASRLPESGPGTAAPQPDDSSHEARSHENDLSGIAQPAGNGPPAADCRHADRAAGTAPTVAAYRLLYNGVGRAYHWVDRNLMPDDVLLRIIVNELVEINVLYVNDQTAGYVGLTAARPAKLNWLISACSQVSSAKGWESTCCRGRCRGRGHSGRGEFGSILAILTTPRPCRPICKPASRSMTKSCWNRSFPENKPLGAATALNARSRSRFFY